MTLSLLEWAAIEREWYHQVAVLYIIGLVILELSLVSFSSNFATFSKVEYCQYLPQNFLIFIAPSLLFPNWWNVLRIYGGGQMEFSRREYKGDRTALEWLLLKSFPWETKMWEIRQKEIFKDLNKYCSALVEHFKDLIQRMSHFEVCTSYRLWRWCLLWWVM